MALFKSRNAAARIDRADAASEIEVQQETIGRALRRTREENGLDLQQVSQVLRIRYFYLDAIEKGNFDRLPGPAYAAGFIRTYADFLGLDPDSAIQGYRQERDRPKVAGNLTFPTPEQETRIPGAALLLIGLLTAVLAYGGWYYLSERSDGVLDLVPELPDRLAELVSEPEQGADVPEGGVVLELPSSPEPDGPATNAEPQEVSQPLPPASSEPEPTASEEETSPPRAATIEPARTEESSAVPEESDGSFADDLPAGVAETAGAPGAVPAEDRLTALTDTVEAQEPEPDLGAAVDLPDPQSSPVDDLTSVLEDLPSPPPAAPPATVGDGSQAGERSVGMEQVIVAADTTVSVPSPEEADGSAQSAMIYGEENVEARVVLQATQDSWVQVRDADGELLLTRVLRPGDIYRAPDVEGLTLLTGNAGGLDIFLDGLKLPALGPVGAVRRNIALDPGSLLAERSGVE